MKNLEHSAGRNVVSTDDLHFAKKKIITFKSVKNSD